MRRWLILTTAAMLALGGLVPAVSPVSVASAAVPSGFTDSLVGTVSSPTTVVGLPDGRAVVLQKGGSVRIVKNGAVLPASAISFGGMCTSSEQGLIGFAADPAFSVNGFVYIYRTHTNASAPGGCVNRVSRFTMAGDTIVGGSEVILIDNIASEPGNHNGGDLEIGNDGFLYVSVGDGGCNPRTGTSACAGANTAAQDLSLLNGKILRVDRNTGFAAPGNPLSGFGNATDCRMRGNNPSTPITWCKEIFAWGLRNPYRFAFDTNTGGTRFNINDVGQGTREEVNVGAIGANYGWPAREGVCKQASNPVCQGPTTDPDSRTVTYCRPSGTNVCVQPILDYPHNPSTGGDYITGAAFVPDGAWPAEYDGGYFLADGDPGKIVFRAANGTANFVEPFQSGSGLAAISDLNFVLEPTGWALYYVANVNGQVRKITYNTAAAPSPGAMKYTPLATSDRVFDTRDAGADTGPIRAGTTRLVDLNPPTGTARAALVNLTFASTQGPGFVSSWTPRTTRPASSNLNASATEVVANSAIVPLDADGKTIIMSSVTADVVVDVLGFFDTSGATSSGRFTATSPLRITDTRNASAPGNTYTRTGTSTLGVVNVPVVSSAAGVPAGTSAVAVIVTGLSGDAVPDGGYAVAYKHGDPVPATSTVNVNGFGDTRANLAVVPVGADGSIDLQLFKTANVLVDVVGYFTGSGASSSTTGLFVSLPSLREINTRDGGGLAPRFQAGDTRTFNSSNVPDNALAIAQNLTVTETIGAGFITSWPSTAAGRPDVSNGNATGSGQTRAAFSITPLGTTGAASYYSFMNTQVLSDFAGYFQG